MNPEDYRDPVALIGENIPKRVVSLVPSYTESLFDLGLGETVVGITDYCTRPVDMLSSLSRVGGPKDVRVKDIISLKPELVVANREENTQVAIESILRAGIPVWLTFPLTVQDSIDDLYKMAGLFRSDTALMRVQMIERSVEWARLAVEEEHRTRYFCPVWQDHLENGQMWWMTFNRQTYSSDLLSLLGGENVFAERLRRYPLLAEFGLLPEESVGERDTRYPRVTLHEIEAASPEVILLPDEPYPYGESDASQFSKWFGCTPAVEQSKLLFLDGSLITWYGTRISAAIQELSSLFLIDTDR